MSSRGNKCAFGLCDCNSNSILTEPMKNRTAPKIVRAFKVPEQLLTNRGLTPKLHRLDNDERRFVEIAWAEFIAIEFDDETKVELEI